MSLRWKFAVWTLIGLLILAAGPVKAQQDPRALVSQMVKNELSTQNPAKYWMYQQTEQKHGNSEVKDIVETPQCWLTWPISYDGKPPTPAQEEQARQELDKLVNDPNARRRNRAAIDQDSKKADEMVKILPDAFLFTDDGRQDGTIHLSFRPNPEFRPPSRAAKVFHDMQGTLVINEKEMRLVSISGRLMSNVDFGWGVLGELQKGGTFHVEQTEVAPQDWEVSRLDVHITGHALLFKTISEQQHQVNSDFRPVPSGLSLAQAASLLQRKSESASVQ